jgi:hypothetical protein
MPNIIGGYQPDTKAASARRADFDLHRREKALASHVDDIETAGTELEARVEELERIVAILAAEVTVGSYVSFSFNATTSEPIVGNQIRINNASQTAATKLWVSHSTFDGLDVTAGLSRVTPGDVIYIQDFDDGSKWVRYLVSAATNDGTYHDFDVTYQTGPGTVPFQKVALRILFQGVT